MAGSRRPPVFGLAGAPGGDAQPVDARDLLAASRSLHPGRSWVSLAWTVYIIVFAAGIGGILFWSFWKRAASFFLDVASPYHYVWGIPAVVLILLGVLRYSTLQGFVSFSEADCLFLLGAPVPRSDLIRPRLRRMAIGIGALGAIAGLLAAVASRGSGAGIRLLEGAVAGVALALIAVAAGWHIQRLPAAALWVLRLTLPALGVAALLGFAESRSGVGRLAALWSGPWGWALLPFNSSLWAGLAGLLLLCALAVAGWLSVRVSAGDASLEGFAKRASTRSRVLAGIYAMDARSIALAGRQPRGERWRARLRFRAPRRAALAVPWHGALVLLRSPLRLGWAVVLAPVGVLLLATQPGRAGTSWAGALALYLSASALIEPLRLEVDNPAASAILLPWRFGRLLWLHCLAPVAMLVVLSLLALLGGWALGFVDPVTAHSLVLLAIPLVCVVVLSAALSARRGGRVSEDMLLLTAGDSAGISVLLIIGWMFMWAIIGIVAVGLMSRLLVVPRPLLGGPVGVAIALAVLAVILWRVLAESKR